MVEWKISEIRCAHDIYEERLVIEKNFNTWFSLGRDKKPENYIWNEDMTVRQNKELTAKHNAEIAGEIKKRQDGYHIMIALHNKRIYKYIIANCNVKCSEKQAEVIWNYCETQHEDDPHNYVDDVIGLFEKLMEADR